MIDDARHPDAKIGPHRQTAMADVLAAQPEVQVRRRTGVRVAPGASSRVARACTTI